MADYRTGRSSLQTVLDHAWGLYTAAELKDVAAATQFERLYLALSYEHDLFQPFMPSGYASQERLDAAVTALEAWASNLREDDGSI